MRAARAPHAWQAYRQQQRARRHRRVAARLEELRRLLPPGVDVQALGPSAVRCAGHGIEITYDATHHRAGVGGGLVATMTPRQVAHEFTWRYRRGQSNQEEESNG